MTMADTTTSTPEHEFGAILAELDTLRSRDARAPTAISLGPAQKAAVAAYVQHITGQADAGPIVSFQSLPVVDGADGVSLVFEGDAAPIATPAAAPWPFIGTAPGAPLASVTVGPPLEAVAPPAVETVSAPAAAAEAAPAVAEVPPSGV